MLIFTLCFIFYSPLWLPPGQTSVRLMAAVRRFTVSGEVSTLILNGQLKEPLLIGTALIIQHPARC